MGPKLTGRLERYGFNPGGGGHFVEITPPDVMKPLEIVDRSTIIEHKGKVVTAQMPRQIAQIEIDELTRLSKWPRESFRAEPASNAIGTGNVIVLEVTSATWPRSSPPLASRASRPRNSPRAPGRRSKPGGMERAHRLASGRSTHSPPRRFRRPRWRRRVFRTSPLTDHSKTHLEIVQKFLEIEAKVETARDKTVTVRLEPKAAG